MLEGKAISATFKEAWRVEGRGFGLEGKKCLWEGGGCSFRIPRKAECSFAYKMTGDLDRRRQGVRGRWEEGVCEKRYEMYCEWVEMESESFW